MMNEDTQYRLLFDDPIRLLMSNQYKKTFKNTVKKFVSQKLGDDALTKDLLQQCKQALYDEMLLHLQKNFDPHYSHLLPFFEYTVYNYCSKVAGQLVPE